MLIRNYLLNKHLDKTHRHHLGQDIINLSWQLMDNFVVASHSSDRHQKIAAIRDLNLTHLRIRERYRLMLELKIISLRQQVIINNLMVETGKMIGGWLKKTHQAAS